MLGPQRCRELGIQFDGDNASGAFEQLAGERSLARANLNDQGLMRGAYGGGDSIENRIACEEVLSEAASDRVSLSP